MATLYLPLKGCWYRMIEAHEKPEEYRDLNPYWLKRIFEPATDAGKEKWCDLTDKVAYNRNPKFYRHVVQAAIDLGHIRPKPYTDVEFSLGYPKRGDTARRMRRRVRQITYGRPVPAWCPKEALGKTKFVIRLED